jgi:preprotein translocase subunit SecD
MTIRFARFNIYLAAVLATMAAAGCASSHKDKGPTTLLSLHLEVSPDDTDTSSPVPVLRANPSYVNVDKESVLDEGSIDSARVVDDLGGFHIQVKFNWEGAMVLDGVTTDNHNRRIAVLARWDKESRWLAAPVIKRRISDGVYDFTPDATREEAQRIVLGLNNLAAKVKDQDKM